MQWYGKHFAKGFQMGSGFDLLSVLADSSNTAANIPCSLSGIVSVLQGYRARVTPLDAATAECLSTIKKNAVVSGDQALAKAVWCLESISAAQDAYLVAFSELARRAYYGAWD